MTRKVRSKSSKPLRFESLESRRLLAVAAFQTELLHDVEGVPGDAIVDNTLTAGESFFLRISAEEFHPWHFGLRSVSVDVQWDVELLEVIEEDFSVDSSITDNLPLIRSGTLDPDAGTIRDLSGTAMLSSRLGRAIGNGYEETFALIPMRAGTEPGSATIELGKSDTKTIMVPAAVLGSQHLRFDLETINIVASDEPAAANNSEKAAESNALTTDGNQLEQNSADEQPPQEREQSEASLASEQIVSTAVANTAENASNDASSATSELSENSLVVTPPIESIAEPAASQFAELGDASERTSDQTSLEPNTVDQVITFDMNQDGVFDFADFGLLNVHVAQPASQASTTTASGEVEGDDSSDEIAMQHAGSPASFLPPCLGELSEIDIEATENWLDAFAAAWIADRELRHARNQARSSLF